MLYYCLRGRPPVFAERAEDVAAAIVTFAPEAVARDGDDELAFFPAALSADARALVLALMEPDARARLALAAACAHAFFRGEDVHARFRSPAHPLARGGSAPQPDARWAQRQHSTIWASLLPDGEHDDARARASSGARAEPLRRVPETALEARSEFGTYGGNGGAPGVARGRAPFAMGAIGEDDAGSANPALLPALRARSALDKENHDRSN